MSQPPPPSETTPAAAGHATVLPPGTRLGDYAIVREAGRGAMGVVYEAVHVALDKRVALKVLPAEFAAGRLDRFLREARIAAALHHTNIVPVFDVGIVDGIPYYAMQFIEGRPLGSPTEPPTRTQETEVRPLTRVGAPGGETLSQGTAAAGRPHGPGRHPPREAARFVLQVADGLAYAHTRGVVHRDVKPSNLILDSQGVVWIADFGLAFRPDDATLTRDGAILGTPRYMAPEQARGDGDVDARADVYALGVTLYELLTGRPALPGRAVMELLRQVEAYTPPPPRSVAADVPRDLETVATKAMAKRPADRYQSAREMADDLRRFLAGEPIKARRISVAGKTWRWAKRNPAVATLVTAIALLLSAFAVAGAALAERFKGERDAARSAENRAVEAERDRGRWLIRATLNEVRARRASGRQGQRFESLAAVRQLTATLPPDLLTPDAVRALRDEAVACLALPDVRATGPARPSRSAGFQDADADESLDVYASEDPATGATLVGPLDDPGREVRLPAPVPNQTTRTRRLSRDGRWLAEMHHDPRDPKTSRLRVWEWREARASVDVRLEVSTHAMEFTPAGDRLAVGVGDTVQVFAVATGAVIARSPPRFRPFDLRYAPDGRSLAVINDGLPSEVVDAETWRTEAVLHVFAARVARWSPDGRALAVGTATGETHLWNRDGRATRLLEGSHIGPVSALHYAGSRYLISAAFDQRSFVRDPIRGDPVLTLDGRVLRVSADGRRLAVLREDKLVVYEFVGVDGATLKEHPGWAESVEFDPLGRWLAVASGHGTALCPVETLAPEVDLGVDDSGPPAFRPDGGELVTYGLFSQVLRWPITPAADGKGFRVGPPAAARPRTNYFAALDLAVDPQREGRVAAWSRDGRTVAWADDRNARVYVADAAAAVGRVLASLKARRVAVNPDGTLVAVSVLHDGIQVVRVADGRTVHRVPGDFFAAFSPDGRRLVTASHERYAFRRTDTWAVERSVPCEDADRYDRPIAFRGDGRLVAFPVSRRSIRLVSPETGTTLLTLTNPEPVAVLSLSFHPSGDRLAAARAGHNAIVWNLAELHRALQGLGLAWDESDAPFAQAMESSPPTFVDRGKRLPPPKGWYGHWERLAFGEAVEGRFGDAVNALNEALARVPPDAAGERARIFSKRAGFYLKLNSPWAALGDWRQTLALVPGHADAAQGVARILVLGPADLRDPLRGLQQAQANYDHNPNNPETRLVLGAAFVFHGRHREALEVLEKIPASRRGPLDDYLRAVARFSLGRVEEAAAGLAAAKAAQARLEPGLDLYSAEELRRVRDEAERVVRPVPSAR